MKIFVQVSPEPNAILYYRLGVPMETLADLSYPVDILIDHMQPWVTGKLRQQALIESDVYYTCASVAHSWFKGFKVMHNAPPHPETGHYPPMAVLDLDDSYWDIHPTNPAFFLWGTKRPDGTPLEPGEELVIQMDNGEQSALWRDEVALPGQEAEFSVIRNRENIRNLNRLVGECAGVVVSNEALADEVRKHTEQRNIFVLPNMIHPDHYDDIELAEHPGEVRLLWQGGANHFHDLYPIRDTLRRVLNRYDNVKMIFFGQQYDYIMEALPSRKKQFIQWVPFERYRCKLGTLGHDINLCPLEPGPFNEVKTPIKWYESSMISRPAVTLAANVGPFKREIQDGVTGVLYNTPEEFEQKLEMLIENEVMRKELAQNAKKWVRRNRDPFVHLPRLYEWLAETRARQINENPHQPPKEIYDAVGNVIRVPIQPDVDAGQDASRAVSSGVE